MSIAVSSWSLIVSVKTETSVPWPRNSQFFRNQHTRVNSQRGWHPAEQSLKLVKAVSRDNEEGNQSFSKDSRLRGEKNRRGTARKQSPAATLPYTAAKAAFSVALGRIAVEVLVKSGW
jgi:hypothetical protein